MSEAIREPERASEDYVTELWRSFKATADPDAREGLILNYSPLVKFVAGRVGVGLPRNVEQADLISYGIFGLIDAIDKFDLERGFKSRRTRSAESGEQFSMSCVPSTGCRDR